ncbi:ABC transporter ATP-binding protein [Caldibacillus thermoamylovorans]
MIKFENVSKRYEDGTVAVNSLNLEIKQGEFFVFIGPSGCGKTTTLKMINRLIPLSDGTIFIDGKKINAYDIHELRWNIGYVLQQIALFPHMTIEQNITVVPEMKKWPKEKMKQRAYELMNMVGLDPENYADRKPNELSGGEQQRIGVIRALAADPEIILMDEPFSALDPISREKLQDDMIDLKRNLKKTTVFVTHDMQEALKLADRICMMKDGEIVQVGTPQELVTNPANDFVREFVGKNLETGRITSIWRRWYNHWHQVKCTPPLSFRYRPHSVSFWISLASMNNLSWKMMASKLVSLIGRP